MSVIIVSYNIPSGVELQPYLGKVPGWIDRALSGPGAVEFRAYRSIDGKEALTITEYDSLASAEKWLTSDKYKQLRNDMEKAGCKNIQVQTWDMSPLVAKPVRARASAT